jgi:prolyl oligopeptidase
MNDPTGPFAGPVERLKAAHFSRRTPVNRLVLSLLMLLAVSIGAAAAPYPEAPRSKQVDVYNGVRVADPYRPLENPDRPATRRWIEAENRITHRFLASIPERGAIRARLTALWNYERYGVPFREGGRYFYFHNDGLQNQAVLYTTPSLGSKAAVLLDPNTLSKDGTVALNTCSVSHDGRWLAYGLSAAGSDWVEFHIRDIETGQDLPEVLKWVKFSDASWSADGQGFFYSRYDEPRDPSKKMQEANYFQKVYYHRLHTPQADDVRVYDRPDQKEWSFNGEATRDGRYLLIYSNRGTDPKNRVYLLDLQTHPLPEAGHDVPRDAVKALVPEADAAYNFVDNDGSRMWFFTTRNAPRGAVLSIDAESGARTPLIAQAADTLRAVTVVGRRFVCDYLHDAHGAVRLFTLEGRPAGAIPLPGLGSVGGFTGHRGDHETFYSYTSFTTPTTIYRYDLERAVSTVFRKPRVAFHPEDFSTRQIFYHSKDGTRVPMYITARKGVRLDGRNPVLLYGYGGFDIPILPSFSPANMVWMEMGGVYAVANIRGGGEYGEAWHLAGTLGRKQNVFDDFIAAGEWLVAHRWTTPARLAILGRSNGGLLVGAALTQRPDLFGAAIPGVGVLDMLRFNKFTIGWAWTSDYGSPENPKDFKALYRYSPLHNIRPGTHYPATLVITADHDDRVVPAHSFKFAAALQAAQAGSAPVLIRIETRAGHGAGKPTSKLISEVTDQWAFLLKTLKMRLPVGFAQKNS